MYSTKLPAYNEIEEAETSSQDDLGVGVGWLRLMEEGLPSTKNCTGSSCQ